MKSIISKLAGPIFLGMIFGLYACDSDSRVRTESLDEIQSGHSGDQLEIPADSDMGTETGNVAGRIIETVDLFSGVEAISGTTVSISPSSPLIHCRSNLAQALEADWQLTTTVFYREPGSRSWASKSVVGLEVELNAYTEAVGDVLEVYCLATLTDGETELENAESEPSLISTDRALVFDAAEDGSSI